MELALGNSANFFAVRGRNEFSFDGEYWYKEGDKVNLVADTIYDGEITLKTIFDDGRLLLETEHGEYLCNLNDILISRGDCLDLKGHMDSRISAIRERMQFSIDLENWFSGGQRCTVRIADELMQDAMIKTIFEDGKILFAHDGIDVLISYTEIMEIYRFVDKPIFVFPSIITECILAEYGK